MLIVEYSTILSKSSYKCLCGIFINDEQDMGTQETSNAHQTFEIKWYLERSSIVSCVYSHAYSVLFCFILFCSMNNLVTDSREIYVICHLKFLPLGHHICALTRADLGGGVEPLCSPF